MIDRRAMLAAAVAAWASAGAGQARPRGARPGDLEGTWTLATYTDFERPAELPALVLTPAQAEAYEAPRRALHGMIVAKTDELGQSEAEFNERGEGLARVRGQIRSSWIVDPPDGQIPFSKAGLAALALDGQQRTDNPEDLNGPTRCLANAAAGAPMFGAPDTNLFQIVQTRDAVAISSEKYHEVRIVRMGRAALGPPQPPAWMGDSVGRWEGKTLVVETTGGHPGAILRRGGRVFGSATTKVAERFTRTGPDELTYEFTVEDPVLYTRPWRGEMALKRTTDRMFEFACHEGNYALPGILAGGRVTQTAAGGK